MGYIGLIWSMICVKLLIDSAQFLGITYEEINVWLFVVIWPLLSLVLFAEVIRLRIKKDN